MVKFILARQIIFQSDVLIIRKKYKEGISTSELYKAYPQVSKTTV